MEIFKNNNMANNSVQKITAAIICANMLIFGMPASVIATDISGVNPTGNVYNIEGDKFSGSTQFRQYDKFNLSQGDIANLIYKNGYDKFVNLVDNQVVINGIVNTMRNNNFYNGHAIFVSPNGIVIGASGILNVGSLTMMAPSQNAYKSFLNNYANNLSDYEFDLTKENYKSLITNSSGDIIINGQIYARNDVNAYGRRILTNVNPEDILSSANASPKIVAGIQDKDNVITKADEAEALFNSLVLNDTKDAEALGLKDGKIALITNKANEEILTKELVTNSGSNSKTTTTINTTTGLKIVNTKTGDIDSKDNKGQNSYSIDNTYQKSSLSGNNSEVKIDNTTIVANEIKIEANDNSEKEVNTDTIKNYNDALASSQNNNNNNDSSNADQTSDKVIHKSFKDVAPEASAKIEITNSKLIADEISINAKAKNNTETYIQLLDTIYEKWITLFGSDVVMQILMAINKDEMPENASYDWQSWEAIKSYFSDDPYNYFDGARAAAQINITNSDILAGNSVDITSEATSKLKLKTGTLDSSPAFMYGLGASVDSKITIKDSTIKTSEEDGTININAISSLTEQLKYDGTKFLSLFTEEKKENSGNNSESGNDSGSSGNGNSSDNNSDSGSGNNDSSDSGNSNSDAAPSADSGKDNNSGNSGKGNEEQGYSDGNGIYDNDNNNDNGNGSNSDSGSGDSGNNSGSGSGSNSGSGNYGSGSGNGGSEEKNKVSAYNLVLLNNTVKNDTNVTIDNSTIESTNLNVRAIGYNETDVSLKNVSNVGKNSEHTGISAGMLINHFRSDSKVDLKNNSKVILKEKAPTTKNVKNDSGEDEEITITYGNANFIAQNVNNISNSVESEVKAKDQTNTNTKYEFKDNDKGILSKAYGLLNDKLFSKVGDKIANSADKLSFEFSGSGIWNDEISTSNANIDNSTVNATKVNVASNLVDLTINEAKANAGANNKFGASAAVIVDDQHNTSHAQIINNSKITAKNEVKVNATTQLPMNPMELSIGQKLENGTELNLGVGFDQGDGITSWDAEFLHTELKKLLNPDTLKSVGSALKKPKDFVGNNELSMEGLFNNFAKAEGSAETAAIAGSVVANSILNDTIAEITNSDVNVTGSNGNVNVNAANSVVNYNAVGKVDFLIEEINDYISKIKGGDDDEEEASKFGLGGSVLVSDFQNNSTAKIDSSKVIVNSGDINVGSAQEEAYINALVTGGSAGTFVIEGSVNVQNIGGKTSASIINSNDIKATTVNVNAGNANIATKKKGDEDPFEFDDDSHELSVNDERQVNNELLVVNMLGVNAKQEGSGSESQTSSSGASVGASVNVAKVEKEIEATIDNSTVTADEVTVNADTVSKKIDVILAAASAGGYNMKESKEEGKKSNEEKEQEKPNSDKPNSDSDKPKENESSSDDNNNNNDNDQKKSKNIGNWMDMLDEAGDDEEDVMNLNGLFAENDASEQAQSSVKENSEQIKTTDKTVDKDGNEATPTEKTDSNKKSNADVLTDNDNKKLEGDENKKADTSTASSNFSLAAAGSVDITKDETKTTAKITNSTINTGKKADVSSNYDAFVVDVNGGFAKAGNVAVGAGVNIYRNHSAAKSLVENSIINFTLADAEGLNVLSNAAIGLYDVTVGIGAATNNEDNVKIGVGGSFGWNTLKNTISSKINNSTVKKENDAKNPNVTVEAKDNSKIWNVTGGVAYSKGGEGSTGIGAGIASTVNYSSKDIVAEVINSNILNAGDVKINADLTQDYNTIAIAAALATGSNSSYNFDGAVNTEVNTNKVAARGKDSTIVSDGDVSITATEKVANQSLAGGLDFSTSQSGVGVGIGAIVNVDKPTITAEADNLKVEKSNSIDIKAKEIEDLKFLAVNLGIQTSGGTTINVNGISNVFIADIVAHAINNSVLNSTGNVGINSIYNNTLGGITVAAGGSMDGNAIGANLIANVYNNHVTAELKKGSKINTDGNVSVKANASEEINLIPVGVTLSNGGSAVAANINANVFVDTIKAQLFGEVEKSGSVLVDASDITSVTTRGGTLRLSNGASAIGGNVNVDVLDKKVTAEIKDTTVNSTGEVNVVATSVNAFGVTKDDNGNYAPASLDYAKQYTAQDSNNNYKERSATDNDGNDAFANWNMFYDLSASFNASVSGAIVVKVIDNEVNSYIQNSNINAGSINVASIDNTAANAIIGRLSYGGTASVGANVFVMAGSSDVKSQILSGSKLNADNNIGIVADSAKRSTLISVAGGASGTASVNGSAVANVINDTITAKIDDGVNIETGSLNVNSNSNNDVKGLVVNASGAGTAAIGAVVYVNKQKSENTAQIGTEGNSGATIKADNDIIVKSQADDEFSALLVNANGAGGAAVGAMGLLNFVDSDVKSGVYNSNVTSEHGKVDVIADRGFNRQKKASENIFRSWFKDTSAYKKSGSFNSDGTTQTEADPIDKDDIDKLKPKVGLFSVAAAGTAAVNVSVISNKMEGNITSEVKNSTVSTENGLNVQAKQNFTNYDAMASIAGAGNAAVNVSGVINLLENNVTAQLDHTTVTKGGTNVYAKSVIEANQVVLAGQGAGVGAAVGASVDVNKLDDKVYAYVKNGSEVHGGTNVNAEHSVEINNILLGATIGGTGFAGNFIPLINTYSGATIAQVINSNVNDGDINITANDYIDNFSAVAGIAGAGVGASMNGFLIKNNYENTVEAGLKDITVNTNNNINIASSSVLDSENALLSGGITGVGANISVNVIINSIDSTVNSYIDDTVITKAGDITLTANKDKNGNIYQDNIHNLTGNVGVTGVGGSASTNLIFNIYDNTTESYVKNTDIQKAANLVVEAHGDKRFKANNYGITLAGLGGAALVDAVSNQIESETRAYVLANYKDENGNAKDINVDNEITVTADDRIIATSDMGFAAAAAGGAGANVNLSNYNEVVSAEILTDADNKINAKQANVSSNVVYALKNSISGLAAGAGAIAGDVSIVHLGKREVIDDKDRENSKINEALNTVQKQYNKATSDKSEGENPSGDGKFNATTSSKENTGAIARVNGNLTTTNDINLNAKTVLKGVNNDGNLTDTLAFDNLSVAVGGVAVGVGVKLIDFSNSTDAEITGGKIKADGNININSESVNDVKVTNEQFSAAAGSISGAVGIYDNKALTNSKITNADVNAKNVNINAKSSNKADISSESETLALANINVSIAKVIDKNVTNAVVTGNTDITADNLNLHATGNSDVASSLQTLVVSGANIAVINSRVDETSVTNAIIKNVNGDINVAGLNLVSSSDKLVASTSTNTTSVSGLNIGVTSSGANMNATMRAGIDSIKTQEDAKGLTINNSGKTIILSGAKASDVQMNNLSDLIENKAIGSAIAESKAYIENKGFDLLDVSVINAKAINNVISNAIMKSDNHNADSLKILAKIDEQAKAELSSLSVAAIGAGDSSLLTDVTGTVGVDVEGINTIANVVDIEVDSNVKSSHSLESASYGIASGAGLGMTADVNSNTTLNIGGELNADSVYITTNTDRYSKMDYSSSSGGAIAVTSARVNNKVRGNSVLNLENYTPSKDYANKLNISHNSTNTQDTISSSISGGVVSIDSTTVAGELSGTSVLNIKNSKINTENDINITVNSTNIVKDLSTAKTYGIVAITSKDVSHTYSSGSKINIINSEVNSSKNINLAANSGVSSGYTTDGDGYVHYAGESGAFDAKEMVSVSNTLNENNSINLQNSSVKADDTVTLAMKGNSEFSQKVGGEARGFAGSAHNSSTLTLNNTNTLNVDQNSIISSANKTRIDLDSNNSLSTRADSDSYSFGFRDAEAHSNLYTNINNSINNSGTIASEDLVDINFMNNSENHLDQFTHTEAHAIVPTTTIRGSLIKTVNNALNVADSGKIASKKDVDINYSSGIKDELSSALEDIHQYYIAFGYTTREVTHNSQSYHNPSLQLYGDIIAGEGNDKYMKINSDGTVDQTSLRGLSADNYALADDSSVDGQTLKNNAIDKLNDKIANINIRIQNLEETIDLLNNEETGKIKEIENSIKANEDILQEIDNYSLKSENEWKTIINNDYKALVRQDLINNGDVTKDKDGNITGVTVDYEGIINAYNSHISTLDDNIPTITEFINGHETYKNLTDTQKAIFANDQTSIIAKIGQTVQGKYTTYDGQYMLALTTTIPDNTVESGTKTVNQKGYLEYLNTTLKDEQDRYNELLVIGTKAKEILINNRTTQENNRDKLIAKDFGEQNYDYSVVFGDIASEASGINIRGINENNISGNGNFKADSTALTIDNYSARSIVFNEIDFGADDKANGLVINGKNYSDYMNNPDKLIGHSNGTHYISDGISGNGDITVNNYYNPMHPFASELGVKHNDLVSNIILSDDILTTGKIDLFNDSGDITILAGTNSGSKELVSTNGNVNIMTDTDFVLKSGDSMFAGNDVNVTANNAALVGDMTAGNNERKLVITDAMLNDLVVDPMTGETNMIDPGYLGDENGNNIKAIYKDGQIYLFGIKDSAGNVNMNVQSGIITANIKTKEGYRAINIDNQTDKIVNISQIENRLSGGKFTKEGNADYTGVQHTANNLDSGYKKAEIKSNGGINFNSKVSHSGNIEIINESGDITMSDSVYAYNGNMAVSQNNGNIINGVVVANSDVKHSSNDIGNPDSSYKTLLGTTGDLVVNVTDGDIGVNSNPNARIGIDGSTRDYTDSINVTAGGKVTATAKNSTKTDKRFINLRAKDSDLNIKDVTSDGDIVLTAADWKTTNVRPTPDNDEYFEGYSILNASENGSPINGQNVSLISSNTIGSADKKMVISQDTSANNGAKVSLEAENDVYVDLKSTSNNPLHVDSIISKRGDIELKNSSGSIFNYITSGGDLHILETGKELTIYNIGGNAVGFDDILYPHDNIGNGTNAAVPQSIEIEVLDAMGGSNADSTLKIYTAYVQGRNKGQGEYNSSGRQIADVSLMADNIYVNSANAKSSSVSTLKNPKGYKPANNTYTDTQIGLLGDSIYKAQGINSYGEGKAIVLDVKGVSKEFVDDNTNSATRTNYNIQTPVAQDPKFANPHNQIIDHDYRAKNVVLSVNNNSSIDRDVVLNSIYADDAYVDTKGMDLSVKDGYIKDYAEFSNADKKITVDNNFRRRLRDADTQLFTAKTGSFSLGLDSSIDMKTTAPIVGNDFDKLANDYQSEGNFVNRSRKDSKDLTDSVDKYKQLEKQNYQEKYKRSSLRFNTVNDNSLKSNYKIYDLSTTGALVRNDINLKVGDFTNVRIVFDDIDVSIKSKVISISGKRAGLEFIDMPKDVANKILYRYMQIVDSMKQNSMTSSL